MKRHATAFAMNRLASLLLLVPFLLLALIPSAAMPLLGADGRYAVVLCTGDGPLAVMLDAEGNPIPPMGERCDWAAAATATLLHDAALPVAPAQAPRAAGPAIAAVAATPAQGPRGAYPRGPPLLPI